jgi:hypothetical protein
LKGETNDSASDYGYEEGELTTKQISYDTAQNAISQSLAFTGMNLDNEMDADNNFINK